MNVHKARKNPENLCHDRSSQGKGKESAAAPSFGFASMSDCPKRIAAERQSTCNPMRACSFPALRIVLLASVFAATPLLMNQGQGHAREFESTSAAPMIGVSSPHPIRPEGAEEIFDLAAGFEVEKQLMSLPDAKEQPSESQSSESTNPVRPAARPLNEIDQYLWNVYQRSGTKRDSSGDFTWKDAAAAARLGLFTEEYVIGGMDPDFRELLFDLGRAMDADGINWTILSAFRDDYRQSLATGFKAHRGYSFHGGSIATGGYGHGCAADLGASDGSDSNDMVWKWLDQHGERFGIYRPMRQIDPAHVQPIRGWHQVAAQLRDKRVEISHADLQSGPSNTEVDGRISPVVASRSGVSEAQFDCVRHHHHLDDQLRTAGLSSHLQPHLAGVFTWDRAHRHGRWRMLADIREPQKRPGTEASPPTDESHRNASLRTAADTHNAEKRPAAEPLLNTDETHRNANWRTIADIRNPQKRPAAESSLGGDRTHRNGRWRMLADIRSLQKRSAEALRRHARSRGRLHFVGRALDAGDRGS